MMSLLVASYFFFGEYFFRSAEALPTSLILFLTTATAPFRITLRCGSTVTTVPFSIRMSAFCFPAMNFSRGSAFLLIHEDGIGMRRQSGIWAKPKIETDQKPARRVNHQTGRAPHDKADASPALFSFLLCTTSRTAT